MKIQVSLFGALRSYQPDALITLEVPAGARVADLREAMERYGCEHWPDFSAALLRRSAFASEVMVLRDGELLPADGRMAVLPPVSGG